TRKARCRPANRFHGSLREYNERSTACQGFVAELASDRSQGLEVLGPHLLLASKRTRACRTSRTRTSLLPCFRECKLCLVNVKRILREHQSEKWVIPW